MLTKSDSTFQKILIDYEFVPHLKSTIVTCLDLLRQEQSESNSPPANRSATLTRITNQLWYYAHSCVYESGNSFHPAIESVFSNIPQLCSLVERTCHHSPPNYLSHIVMLMNLTVTFPAFLAQVLEENIVQRVINLSKPMAVPTTNGSFHLNLVCTIVDMLQNPQNLTEDQEERKRIRKLEFERVLRPAKHYLHFVLQREEFIPKNDTIDEDLPTEIGNLLKRTLWLERELMKDGEIVETGREEWEVGWLVEKTDEESLDPRLEWITKDDVKMRRDKKERWKKRVKRLREAGHEDAMEEWLTRLNGETLSEIYWYLESVSEESGMNNTLWEEWEDDQD
ncbi:hypothetical protein BLNAU_10737 [Blattamonas nauphoetae]|uniref:Uncharacterized protein n=1 Tax=Blattamonas nauphoetae TaxID=2049346 RepID=A0ABQ9XP97_9EUKA|nr:hypothetical protein BLNAU_10737 [Blattamonas nauphoetae]